MVIDEDEAIGIFIKPESSYWQSTTNNEWSKEIISIINKNKIKSLVTITIDWTAFFLYIDSLIYYIAS